MSTQNDNEEVIPEIKDILEMIHRYNAANPNSIFIYGFLGFEKDAEHRCKECGDNCEKVSMKKSALGGFGHIYDIRSLLNDLRDMAEDTIDEDGFVNS